HILVVGHYGCGGVAAAGEGRRGGLVGHWVAPSRQSRGEHRDLLEAISDVGGRLGRLCGLQVLPRVPDVASDRFVQEACARGQQLPVHGWVYSLAAGRVTDLNATIGAPKT